MPPNFVLKLAPQHADHTPFLGLLALQSLQCPGFRQVCAYLLTGEYAVPFDSTLTLWRGQQAVSDPHSQVANTKTEHLAADFVKE